MKRTILEPEQKHGQGKGASVYAKLITTERNESLGERGHHVHSELAVSTRSRRPLVNVSVGATAREPDRLDRTGFSTTL